MPTAPPTDYKGLVDLILGLINLIIPALFAVLFVFFFWKMIDSWILHAGDEQKVAEGKQYAIAAVITFVVTFAVWGIVRLIRSSVFGL